MRKGKASRTAEFMALFRALESGRPARERVFYDPFARVVLPRGLRVVADVAAFSLLQPAILSFIDLRWPGARTSAVARTRLIDDWLTQAVERGAGQVVFLGAGFDARPWRLPSLRSAAIFEVDHPDTLAARRTRLASLVPEGPAIRSAPIDFNRQRLGEILAGAGFDPARRAVIVWEGVSNYLDADAVDAVLRWAGSLAPGGRLIFTYVHRGAIDGTTSFDGWERIVRAVNRAGEPWTFGLLPEEVPSYLADRGLQLIEDLGADAYRARVMRPQGPAARGYAFYRAALAEVCGEG
jgi:methyltransferase (TIGR00027 family)